MASAAQRQMAARQGEQFPTEWSQYRGDESESERQVYQSEDVRLEGRAPDSASEETGRPAFRQR